MACGKEDGEMNTKKPLRWEVIANIVLLCFAISLFNLAGYIFAAVLLVTLVYNVGLIKISTPELTLMGFSLFYFVIYSFHFPVTVEEIVLYLAGPWGAYLIGKQYVLRARSKNAMMTLIVILAAGMCLHGLLNWVAMLRSEYMYTYAYLRISVDFWRGDVVSVTATGMFFAFATGLAVGAIFSKTATKTKVVAVLTLAACLGATIFFANRTLLVIIVIMLVGYTAVMLLSARTSAARKALLLSLLALGLVLLAMAFFFNWFGLSDRIMSLKLFQRISGDEGGRLEQWLSFFKDNAFLRYSMGGDQIAKSADISYLHNLWLDIYNRAGAISFLLIIIFTVLMVKRYIIFRQRMLRCGLNMECTCITALLVATMLNCMVEPVIEANPYYFLIVLMFLGAMNGQTQKLENEKLSV